MPCLYRRNGIYWRSYRLNGKTFYESLRTRDKQEALYIKSQRDQELIEGKALIPNKKLTCLSTLEEYLKYNEHRRVQKVNHDSDSRIRRFLADCGISLHKQITEKALQDHLNRRMTTVSAWEANGAIADINAWLNWCVANRKIFSNPIKGFRKFKTTESTRRFLSKKQIKDVLKAANTPKLYVDRQPTLFPVVASGIYAGMRKEEIFNLEWEDIDFKRGSVTVRSKKGFTTKSRKNRTIPLHDKLRRILYPLRQKAGKCFDITNHRRIFTRIAKKSGIPDLKLHELRHTFASQALMAGVPVPTVSKWLGHSSTKTTMIYCHLCKGHESNEIVKLRF